MSYTNLQRCCVNSNQIKNAGYQLIIYSSAGYQFTVQVISLQCRLSVYSAGHQVTVQVIIEGNFDIALILSAISIALYDIALFAYFSANM